MVKICVRIHTSILGRNGRNIILKFEETSRKKFLDQLCPTDALRKKHELFCRYVVNIHTFRDRPYNYSGLETFPKLKSVTCVYNSRLVLQDLKALFSVKSKTLQQQSLHIILLSTKHNFSHKYGNSLFP